MDHHQKIPTSNAMINKPTVLPITKSLSNISSHSNPSDKAPTIVTITHGEGIEPEGSVAATASNLSNPPSISVHTAVPPSTYDQNYSALSHLDKVGSTGQLPSSAMANLQSGSRTTIPKTDKSKRSTNPLSSSTVVSTSSEPKFSTKQTAFKTNRKDKRSRTRIPMLQPSFLDRPCPHHSFHTDVTDVRKMEQGLVQLLDDFHSGQLQAFGKDCSFQKMERIRDQQEKLARLHFDLGSKQETYGATSKDGCGIDKDHITQLMSKLQELNLAIEELHPNTTGNNLQTEV